MVLIETSERKVTDNKNKKDIREFVLCYISNTEELDPDPLQIFISFTFPRATQIIPKQWIQHFYFRAFFFKAFHMFLPFSLNLHTQ